MSNNLQLRIISSSKIEYENEAEMVLLPGEDGEFGVLVQHMNMLSNLREGVVKIYSNGKSDIMEIKGGIVSIYEGTKLDVLID
jgi:F-type H+-transporting ATPase subunit epsilon